MRSPRASPLHRARRDLGLLAARPAGTATSRSRMPTAPGAAALRDVPPRRQLLGFAPADGQLVELRGRLARLRAARRTAVHRRGDAAAPAPARCTNIPAPEGAARGRGPVRRRRASGRCRLFPRAIGVVTSLGAAALHDVLTALARRAPHVPVVVYPAPCRARGAGRAGARRSQSRIGRAEVDVLIVCRGGGSLEDLWAFNDERVARAIVAWRVPVVCGVGHETDFTLADFAADLRAPTPTAPPSWLAPPHVKLLEHARRSTRRLSRAALHRMRDAAASGSTGPSARLARPSDASLGARLSAGAAGAAGCRRRCAGIRCGGTSRCAQLSARCATARGWPARAGASASSSWRRGSSRSIRDR